MELHLKDIRLLRTVPFVSKKSSHIFSYVSPITIDTSYPFTTRILHRIKLSPYNPRSVIGQIGFFTRLRGKIAGCISLCCFEASTRLCYRVKSENASGPRFDKSWWWRSLLGVFVHRIIFIFTWRDIRVTGLRFTFWTGAGKQIIFPNGTRFQQIKNSTTRQGFMWVDS